MAVDISERRRLSLARIGRVAQQIITIRLVNGRDIQERKQSRFRRDCDGFPNKAVDLEFRRSRLGDAEFRRPNRFVEQRGKDISEGSSRVEEPDTTYANRVKTDITKPTDDVRRIEYQRLFGGGFTAGKRERPQSRMNAWRSGRRQETRKECSMGRIRERTGRMTLFPTARGHYRLERRRSAFRPTFHSHVVSQRVERDK